MVVGLLAYSGGALDSLERSSVDARFAVRGTQPPPSDIVIVGIDDATLGTPGMPLWPFPRRYHAKVIDTLRQAGAQAIGYDIQFTTRTDDADDNALIEAAARTRGIVLVTTQVGAGGSTDIFGGDAVLREIGARAANASILADSDGVLRRFLYAEQGLTTLPVVLAEQATHHVVAPSEFPGGSAPVDFVGRPGTITEIPFVKVYKKQVPPGCASTIPATGSGSRSKRGSAARLRWSSPCCSMGRRCRPSRSCPIRSRRSSVATR